MKRLILSSALILAATSAGAQLTSEPPPGKLATGQSMLVDDGTCGPGKIKKVTGGSEIDASGQLRQGTKRQRTLHPETLRNPVLCTSSVPKLILGPDPPVQFLLRLVH